MPRTRQDVTLEVTNAINHRDFSVVEVTLRVQGSCILGDTEQPLTGIGIARRDPIDRANPSLGFDLATARAIENLGQRAARRANGRVKQLDDLAFDKLMREFETEEVPKKAKKSAKKVVAAAKRKK